MITEYLSKKSLLVVVAILALTTPVVRLMNASSGQTGQRPQFAAASIKPNTAGTTLLNGIEVKFLPGRFTAKNAGLKDLIVVAYHLPYWRIVDGPGWASPGTEVATDSYDIEATAENKAGADQLRLMLRSLLADRFNVVMHREFKPDQDVYNLVVGKNGPKFQEVKVDTYTGNRRAGGGRLSTEQMNMSDLADWLAFQLEGSVYDKTGLSGVYKFDLVFTPEAVRRASSTPPQLQVPGEQPIDPTSGPSLFRALQDQLGLKLEPVKGPLEILVIDHAERPTAN
jgi:uncharacterized protein (TIGR03435 family)